MIRQAFVILMAALLAACSSGKLDGEWQGAWDDKALEGTYRPDISHVQDKNARLLLKSMDVRLVFGDKTEMQMNFMGQPKTRSLNMKAEGDKVSLVPDGSKSKPVLLKRKDNYTLECVECPKGFPRVWNKPVPPVFVLKFVDDAPDTATITVTKKGGAGETMALSLKYEKMKIADKQQKVIVLAPVKDKNAKKMILIAGKKKLKCHSCPSGLPKVWKKK